MLSNARCLAEGVDVPSLDGVAFIEPRRSQIDIVQAVGRAIRKAPDKAIGTIVIPVFVDESADAAQAIEASAFNRVWQVVKALRANDEALADELDELRRQVGRLRTTAVRLASGRAPIFDSVHSGSHKPLGRSAEARRRGVW